MQQKNCFQNNNNNNKQTMQWMYYKYIRWCKRKMYGNKTGNQPTNQPAIQPTNNIHHKEYKIKQQLQAVSVTILNNKEKRKQQKNLDWTV